MRIFLQKGLRSLFKAWKGASRGSATNGVALSDVEKVTPVGTHSPQAGFGGWALTLPQ